MAWTMIRKVLGVGVFALLIGYGTAVGLTGSVELGVQQAAAQTGGQVPGNWSGNVSDAEFWRAIRKGVRGTVSIPDKQAAQLVQSDGDNWRAFKNGWLSQFGGNIIVLSIVVLVVFYLLRGKVMIEHGRDPQGRTIERFNALERATHWLTASSFIILALTGLNVLYGKYTVKVLMGPEAFASLTYYGKLAHNYVAFAFIVGIVLMFILWIKDNFPNRHDLVWISKAGGLFSKDVHPPSKRFNAGQKVIFWLVILGGGSLSISGLALMFPYEIMPWAGTFAILNSFGGSFPTELTPLQETQLSVLWHSLVAMIMIAVVICHIYIGSVGMEGAIDAVGTGQVDLNWAKEHHNLWVEEVEGQTGNSAETQPAE